MLQHNILCRDRVWQMERFVLRQGILCCNIVSQVGKIFYRD